MRKSDKSKYKIPHKLTTPRCLNKIHQSIINIGGHVYSSNYYADSTVHRQLNKIYNGKCAFCESDVRAGSTIQVDHYRPKEGVYEDAAHLGYYWLGYEWTNLIHICSKCNRSKWHKFPIRSTGVRLYDHPIDSAGAPLRTNFVINHIDLINENPLIINPEFLDPSLYFVFLPSGKIKGRGQIEADTTIEVCKLNRYDLQLARKKIRDDLLKKITRSLKDLRDRAINKDTFIYFIKSQLVDLLEVYINNGPYSMFCLNIIKYFDYFIARRFIDREKIIILEAYNEFLAKSKTILNNV